MINSQPYREVDDDLQVTPIPLVSVERGPLAIFGPNASSDLAEAGPLSLRALAAYRFPRRRGPAGSA